MSPDSTHSPDIVTAVIVAHDGAAWLPRVMDAVAKQTRSVQRVVAVDTGSTDRSGSMLAQAFGRPAVFGMDRGTGYGVAVAKALRHRAANAHVPLSGTSREDRTEWVWLLHDDSEPALDALEQLLGGTREAPAAAVFGPKIMDWSDRDVLLEAGTTIDRAGRRITGIEPREVDQGQHDGNRDVLAVSSAGMLVRRDVWEQVGGFDPGMRLFREDTDFCWRVQAAGYRVRVVTDAVVYHVEATARNRRDDTSAAEHRRRQDRRNALLVLTGNLPARPMFAAMAGNLVLSTLRTVFFLLAKRPSAAMDELAAYTSVAAHPLRLMSARRIRASGRQQAFARLGKDLPPGRSFRMLAEYATSTLSKTLPAEAVGSHHATDDPSDDDSMLVDTGLAQRLLTSPGVLLFLILTTVALVAERSLLGSTPLGGGALVPAWGGVSTLWQEYLQGFHPVSIGTTANAPPYVALLAILATVLGGKPWLAVDVILLGCVPLAGVTAYLASRRVTSYVPVRVVGALAYALLPVGMGAVAGGRLGTAVLLVLLPPIAVLVGRIFTAPRRRARRAAWAAGLLTAVVAAFVPLFWLITAVVMAVGLIALRRRDRGLDAVIVVVLPLLLLLPWTLDVAGHPARIFLEAGLARPGLASASLAPRSLLLLSPGGPGLPPFWVTAGLLLAATVAVVISGRRRMVLAGWAVGVTGLIAAAAVSRVAITEVGSTVAVRAWPGPALAIAGAGLLLAVVAAGDEVPGLLRAGRWRSPAGLAVIGLGVVACSAPVLAGANWVTAGVAGPVRPAAGTLLPEFVAVSSDTGPRLRTLVLQAAPGGGVSYLVLRDSDPLIGSQELAPPTAAGQALSKTVATLTAPSGSAVTDQGRALAGFGIGYVLLPAPVNDGLARLLDDVPGLRPVSATTNFQLWRVVGTTARVTVTESGGTAVAVSSGQVNVTAARAPSAGGTLTLAEPVGGWSATLNGHPLTPLAAPVNGWAQGFRLPAGGGSLSVSHSNIGRTAVVALEGLAVLVVIGLGLPGSRTAAEAELEEPAKDGEQLDAQGPGRRRAGHGRERADRPRRRRAPRRGEDEPQLPPDTEVAPPATPARTFARAAAAVPAGVRAGWPRRSGPPDAEDPYSGEEAQQEGASYPGGDSFPGEASRPGGPGYPGSPAPEQPVPVGRSAAADLTGETIAYRARGAETTGRHSHRAGRDQAPAAELGGPQQDYATQTPGPGRDAGPGYDSALPSRGGQDAPRRRGIGHRRARRDQGLPGAEGDGSQGLGTPGGPGFPQAGVDIPQAGPGFPQAGPGIPQAGPGIPQAGPGFPQAGPGTGPGDEPPGDREARERFSLPIRRSAAGQDRASRFGRFGRGPAREAPGGPEQPAAGGGPYDGGGRPSSGYLSEGHPSGPYPTGSYQGGQSSDGRPSGHSSGPYPSGSYQGGRPTGDGSGGAYDDVSHPSGPLPTGPYEGGRPAGGGRGGSYDDAAHPSGPYPSGSYQGGGPAEDGPRGRHSSGPPPTQGSGSQGSGSYASGPSSGTGQAPERERGRRGRSPGHARTTRPGTPRPGGTGPAQQPGRGGPSDDDDAVLSPLPPLPPRAPRRSQREDAGQDRGPGDDQGEADW